MKKSLLSLLLMCAAVVCSPAQSIRLPNECQKILNKNFPGWKLARVSKEVSEYHKKEKFLFEPDLVRGDWNGDGEIDYAALIEPEKN